MNASPAPAGLVAICADGDRIRRLVPDRSDICVLDRGARQAAPLEGRVEHSTIAGRVVVEVPLDGPPRALAAAARLLSSGAPVGTVLALSVPDGSPPPLESLQAVVVSGMRPGVAVDRVRWVNAGSLWWTSRAGPAHLQVELRSTLDRRRAAILLSSIVDTGPQDPIGRWLAAVSAGLRPSLDAEWTDVMAARYLQIGAGQLSEPQPV